MDIQRRILAFVVRANWGLFALSSLAAAAAASTAMAMGVVVGGLIVTINFHLLARTLKSALTPPHLTSHRVVLAKYYARFIVTGVILFFLVSYHVVDPRGLFIGLSVVVASIMLATACEVKRILFKEAL